MDLPFRTHREISFGVQTVPDFVHGNGVETVRTITETEYQALTSYDGKTLYLVQTESGTIKLYLGAICLSADIPAETVAELNRVTTDIQNLKNRPDIKIMTQAEYDALETPDSSTLYVITE